MTRPTEFQSERSTRITIAGNPNCGKTTLFNKLTGSKQKIGNWPGVTVEKKMGSFHYANTDFSVTDLPGIYSLTVAKADHSIDERIAMDFLLSRQTDILIHDSPESHLFDSRKYNFEMQKFELKKNKTERGKLQRF